MALIVGVAVRIPFDDSALGLRVRSKVATRASLVLVPRRRLTEKRNKKCMP
jgi:hypothetical protein